ncbi:MAG TPA: hypothetical protein VKE73_06475, partial [Myxococcota bacterium]|nr:hypothetical protein [Myxococcota bacterium]
YSCSWRRLRGEAVCSTKLLVRKGELEGRILRALTDHVLEPRNVRYAVERALRRFRAGLAKEEAAPHTRVPANPRLSEIDEELTVLARLAEDPKRQALVAELIEGLEEERAEILASSSVTAPDPIRVDLDRLWEVAEARILDLRGALLAGGDKTRAALRSLFGGEPLRVTPDPERKFRVDGCLWLSLAQEKEARAEGRPGLLSVVAGGRCMYVTPARVRCVAWPGGAQVARLAA